MNQRHDNECIWNYFMANFRLLFRPGIRIFHILELKSQKIKVLLHDVLNLENMLFPWSEGCGLTLGTLLARVTE